MRFPLQSVLVMLGVSLGFVVPSAGFAADRAEGPRRVAERFDSLLNAGGDEALAAARALTAGPARRLFPLLAQAQTRLAPFLDTARSRDSILREEIRGDWAVLEVRTEAVFVKPFMGLKRIESEQAVHLHRGAPSGSWRLVDFEDLPEGAHARPRTGPWKDVDSADSEKQGAADATDAALLPVSPLAPSKADMRRVTRLRVRVSLRSGDTLALPAATSGQRILSRGTSWAELETRAPKIPVLPVDGARAGRSARRDSLAVYLASTRELDLSDPLLRKKAAALKKGAHDDAEVARRVRAYVSESFDFKLGATLFATSREALRDRKGDCSEAAVLTAALLRAAGIPSRVVLGYATLERGVWIGHAWAEGFLMDSAGGSWIGVDAALREFPAGASRVALASLSGAREMEADATNLMMRTLSNLDVEILGAWAGDSGDIPLPLIAHPGAAAESRDFWDKLLEGMGR